MSTIHEQCLQRDAEKGKTTTTTQQKGRATQHNSPKTAIFQRKIDCLGWDSNSQPSAFSYQLKATDSLAHMYMIIYTVDKDTHVTEFTESFCSYVGCKLI